MSGEFSSSVERGNEILDERRDQQEPVADKTIDFLRELKKIAELRDRASEIMVDYAEQEPKVKDTLKLPQSPDKHAEGPRAEDHYREILTVLEGLRSERIDAEKLAEILGAEEYTEELEAVVGAVRENAKLLEVFVITHDIAKPDTVGLAFGKKVTPEKMRELDEQGFVDYDPKDTKKKKPLVKMTRDVYEKLFADFAAANPKFAGDDLARAFFEKYPISVTYFKHAEQALKGDNVAIIERVARGKGLTEEEQTMLKTLVELHMEPLQKFTESKVEYYRDFVKKMQERGLDVSRAMRLLQAATLLDGVMGTRRINEETGNAEVDKVILNNFFAAERDYPEFLRREKEKNSYDEAIKIQGAELGGGALIALGLPKGPKVSEFQGAIRRAVISGEPLGSLPDELVQKADEIDQRVKRAREEFLRRMESA